MKTAMKTAVKTAILFRFHDDFELCKERLEIARWLNPATPIYGLYGGAHETFSAATKAVAPFLDDLHIIPTHDVTWKWLHQDLAIREWFMSTGHRFDFECLYDHEYDLLLTDAFEVVVPPLSGRSVALSGLKRLDEVRESWHWMTHPPFRRNFEKYLDFMNSTHGLRTQTYITQGPFPVLTRAFLDEISKEPYPDPIFRMMVSEITYPGMAEALGFTITDTGLHPDWFAVPPGFPPTSHLFHCEANYPVQWEWIAAELKVPGGRRAFHPVKHLVTRSALSQHLGRVDL